MNDVLSGWLNPEGILIECGYYAHMSCATNIVESDKALLDEFENNKSKYKRNEDHFILDKGYCKFGLNGVFFPYNCETLKPRNITKEQEKWILDHVNEFTDVQQKDIVEATERIERYKRLGMSLKE